MKSKPHKTRRLGQSGPEVSAIGLGCMGMSGMYGPTERAESIATIHAAIDAGVTLLDTGDFYGMGHNELLVAEALQGRRREDVVLSVKFGALRGPGGEWYGFDSRPAALRTFLAYSLNRLGVEYIDIYRPARLDPSVPIEDTVGALSDLVRQGYIRHIGLSEVGSETLRRAHAVHPIADLQIEYGLVSRGIESDILPTARELGIGITAYGVLSRGLLGGHFTKDAFAKDDFRHASPRFSPDNLEHNLRLVGALGGIAARRGATTAQIAIAWSLSRGEDIIPLIGARRRERLDEALGALTIELTEEDLAAIEALAPDKIIAGERYGASQMAFLDSEKER